VIAIVVTVLPQIAKLKRLALGLPFPKWLVGCGKEGELIRCSCRERLGWVSPPLCPQCGKPQLSSTLCPGCLSWQADIDGIRPPFRFEGIIREDILQLKYRNMRALSETLAKLLSDYLTANPLRGEVLVAVPIHRKRLRERGYNQSSLLAQKLSKLTNLPVIDNSLTRQCHTPLQTQTKTVAERRNNVAGTFTCREQRLKGRQVLLIDDVATSGATLDACAVPLKATGATTLWGLTLAREI
jgi:ComF family protein